jgi:hypothetical protein
MSNELRQVHTIIMSNCFHELQRQYDRDALIVAAGEISKILIEMAEECDLCPVELATLMGREARTAMVIGQSRVREVISAWCKVAKTIKEFSHGTIEAAPASTGDEASGETDGKPAASGDQTTGPEGTVDGNAAQGVAEPQIPARPLARNPPQRKRPAARVVTTRNDVAISQLGLAEETVDKLFDVGVGTSVQALEYDTNKGLAVLLGQEEALNVLAAIEQGPKV